MTRPIDSVELVSDTSGVFRRFTSFRIVNDLTRPSEMAIEMGDDGTWVELAPAVEFGTAWKCYLNGKIRMTGRVEYSDAPMDASKATTVRLTVRTKLSDAQYASASPDIAVKDTTIQDFVFQLYEPLGYTSEDFLLAADTAKDLITGRDIITGETPVDLEELQEDSAKVNPPETIYAAVDRHLRRFGLMHWDSPDGRIVIGSPNNDQPPLYNFHCARGEGSLLNNVLSLQRVRDATQAPSILGVFGQGGKKDWKQSKIRSVVVQPDLDGRMYRPVLIVKEGIKNDSIAQREANRQVVNRIKSIDSWEIKVDGLSYWDGFENIPYAPDSIATILADTVGGPVGAYLVHKVTCERSAGSSDTTTLSVIRKGLWDL